MKTYKTIFSMFVAVSFFLVNTAFTTENTAHMAATQWQVDPAHSNIGFQVRHFFTPVSGAFKEYNAEIFFDPDNLTESQVNVEIQVNSVNTGNDRRDSDLRSDNFFNIEEYPTISFTSNQIVKKDADNSYAAVGNLTIKDVTKEIELPFTLLGIQDHPYREGVQIAGIQFNYTLDRNEYHVGSGDWVSTAVVAGEVNITGTLELNSISTVSN